MESRLGKAGWGRAGCVILATEVRRVDGLVDKLKAYGEVRQSSYSTVIFGTCIVHKKMYIYCIGNRSSDLLNDLISCPNDDT